MRNSGILPSQTLRALIRDGEITGEPRVLDNQVQPASLDLRLGSTAYRIRASFLPGRGRTVAEKLGEVAMHEIDLTGGAVLETGCVYLVPLMESLALSERIAGAANPKSSTGRLDIFTRLIADGATTQDMARTLYLSERTIKRKVQDVLNKLEAANRAQAVAEAFKRGLL